MDEYYDEHHEDYDDSQDYDQSQPDWNKFYFKFDVTHSPLSDWVKKTVDKLLGDQFVSFPVNSWPQNTESGSSSFLYLGVNYQNQQIWKKKYFIHDSIKTSYMNHITTYAKHFVQQPSYYKGMFDILN